MFLKQNVQLGGEPAGGGILMPLLLLLILMVQVMGVGVPVVKVWQVTAMTFLYGIYAANFINSRPNECLG